MSGFDRLSGALQYQIANTLGWRALRPVQEASIAPILDGKNCVILAPTAGGKTEAAFFPVLSAVDAEDLSPVSVLYLSPIRALLNNQEERVGYYTGLIGRRAFKWHGDVTPSERGKFLAEPSDVLLTTPESLEAMLLSTRIPVRRLFAGLRTVIIDEVHAFADDDRGAHLSALLERFTRYCGHDLQRIGLSATIGNPEEILRWLQGSSKRAGVVVDPRGEHVRPDLTLDYVGNLENAAHVVKALHPGRKRLVFVDSRRQAEHIGKLLKQLDVLTYVTHGSLSVTERRDAERAFAEGEDCVIVATSALELGIDVGDLDHVLQIDAPSTVASFLQRLGRTGRRESARANCTFLATTDAALLRAAAIVQLYREGFVESVEPWRRASHILAHQLMALSIQLGGVGRGDWWAWLDGATAFADLSAEDRASVLEHMLVHDILADHEGKLWLGTEGEKRYGRAHFRQLYAVFDTPRLITVRHAANDIGTIDANFLASIDAVDTEPGAFTLAGRSWQIQHVEWERGICVVRPAPEGRAPRWTGNPVFLGYELCQSMRRVLMDDQPDPSWSQRAQRIMATMRAEHDFLADAASPMIERGDEITWWTFAGGRANLLLAKIIEAALGEKVIARNTSLTCRGEAAKSIAALRDVLDTLRAEGRPKAEDATAHAAGALRGRISKFQEAVPPALLSKLIATLLLDVEGAARTVSERH